MTLFRLLWGIVPELLFTVAVLALIMYFAP
jgi:hypothetical protein